MSLYDTHDALSLNFIYDIMILMECFSLQHVLESCDSIFYVAHTHTHTHTHDITNYLGVDGCCSSHGDLNYIECCNKR